MEMHVMVGNLTQSAKSFWTSSKTTDLPPFSVKGSKIVLGEEGPEYTAIAATLKV